VGLVEHQQRAALRGQPAQPAVEAVRRQHHAGVGDGCLRHHAGHIPASQLTLDRFEVVVRNQAHVSRGVKRHAQSFWHDAVTLDFAEQLVGLTVVLAVEHQHGAAARGGASDADGLRVRLGGRKRELPARQPEALRQCRRDLRAVLGRQQEL
jgi:hypothetical protein